jgi:hypothetical protein
MKLDSRSARWRWPVWSGTPAEVRRTDARSSCRFRSPRSAAWWVGGGINCRNQDKLFLTADLKTSDVDPSAPGWLDRPDSPAALRVPGGSPISRAQCWWTSAPSAPPSGAAGDRSVRRSPRWRQHAGLVATRRDGYKIDYQAISAAAPGTPQPRQRRGAPHRIATRRGGHRVHFAAPVLKPGSAIRSGRRPQSSPNGFFGAANGTAWWPGRREPVDWRTGRPLEPDQKRDYPDSGDPDRTGSDAGAGKGKQCGMPQDLPISTFAANKPPSTSPRHPNGELWLQRPRTGEDSQLTYDVYNAGPVAARDVFPRGE